MKYMMNVKMHNNQLSVKVNDVLTIDAGWWEEKLIHYDGKDVVYRLIHPPKQTMFDQILQHLIILSDNITNTELDFNELAHATVAVCLRWGTYFAVLTDNTKPIWSRTENENISMLDDNEMKRINIEASAAIASWLELIQTDEIKFMKLVKAAQTLPINTKLLADRSINRFVEAGCSNKLIQLGYELYPQVLQVDNWFRHNFEEVMQNSTRWFANALINKYWRNASCIEDIHSGEWEERPLTLRRITPD
jgi:hypothetical protein